VTFASFLGGLQSEFAADVALDRAGTPYLAGRTSSPDFPTTAGAFDRTFGGDPLVFWGEGWVAKVDANETTPPVAPPAPAPAAPALVGATGNPVTFDWDDVAGATSYELQVDDLSSFGLPHVFDATTGVSQLAAGTLPAGTWFWRVRAVNGEGTPGEWSETRTLTIESSPPPPTAPSLLSPASDARLKPGTVDFDWGDVSDASSYTIQIDDSDTFSTPLVDQPVPGSSFATSSLPTKRLWWRVRANDGGPWSGARRFEIKN
jgi:hypothetical protein